jgi:hypothetical protein
MTDLPLTKLPGVQDRVETGPIQFGDDWPGMFIRGDNALIIAGMLDYIAKDLVRSQKIFLTELAGLLRCCHIDEHGGRS